MGDSNNLAFGATFAVGVDQSSVATAGRQLEQGLQQSATSLRRPFTDLGEHIKLSINRALSLDPLDALDRKLKSVATSLSRGRMNPDFEQSLDRLISKYQTLNELSRVGLAQQIQSAGRAISSGPSHPQATSGVTRFFYHNEAQANPEAAYEQAYQNYYYPDRPTGTKKTSSGDLMVAARMLQSLEATDRAQSGQSNRTSAADLRLASRRLQELEAEDRVEVRSNRTSAGDSRTAGRMLQRLEEERLADNARLAGKNRPDNGGAQDFSTFQRSLQQQATNEIIQTVRRQGPASYRLQGHNTFGLQESGPKIPETFIPDDSDKIRAAQAYVARAYGHSRQDMRTQASDAVMDQLVERMDRKMQNTPAQRLSRGDSHKIRFASQNFAFGIDDAIQSYHYGGIGASIRAASNNATAIAGMSIPNPAAAAVTVIGISVLSAIAAKVGSMVDKTSLRLDDTKLRTADQSYRMSYSTSLASGEGRSLYNRSQQQLVDDHTINEQLRKDNIKLGQEKRGIAREAKVDFETQLGGAKPGYNYATFKAGVQEIALGFPFLSRIQEVSARQNANTQLRVEAMQRLQENNRRQEAVLRNVGIERDLSQIDKTGNRDIDSGLAIGSISSVSQYEQAVRGTYQAKVNRLVASGADPVTMRFMRNNLEMDMADRLSDKEGNRLIVQRSNYERAMGTSRFNEQYGGDKSLVGGLYAKYKADQLGIGNSVALGQMSPMEAIRRSAMVSKDFARNRSRAIEDEIEGANPELNPVTRLRTALRRRVEDAELEQGKTPAERLELMKAIFAGAERAQSDILRPSGQRKFSAGRGQDVGSEEDLEMQGRFTNRFQWEKAATDLSQKTMEQMRDAIIELQTQMKIQEEALRRR